jgi:hypothetical protein
LQVVQFKQLFDTWGIAVVVAIGFALRAWGTFRLPLRSLWALGIAAFGLWANVALSNQFHGRPPRWLGYVTAWLAMSCAAAIVGLVLDTGRKLASCR